MASDAATAVRSGDAGVTGLAHACPMIRLGAIGYECGLDCGCEVLPVIEIKPGSDPAPINVMSNGVIPVAIVGSELFDVDDVDRSMLFFGPSGASPADRKGGHRADVNVDGFEDLRREPYTSEVVVFDGGVYDNLGLETAWERYRTILVSDAGGRMRPEPDPQNEWVGQSHRVLDLIDNQVRSLRKRHVVGSFVAGLRKGAYWGVRTDIADYQLSDALPCPYEATLKIAATPTRLTAMDDATQQLLINWGYAVCDAAARRYVATDPVPPPRWPIPAFPLDRE